MTRHFVTDRVRFGVTPAALVDKVTAAVARGASVVQIRERDLSDLSLLELVQRCVAALQGSGAAVVVNDRVDVALAAGADGVHLRGDSVAASRVRRIVPPAFAIGRSVHTLEEVDAAVADGGCDYLTFGTVFATASKPADHPIAGLEVLREVCRRSPLPVIAIGGMTPQREADVARAGAAGLAAVGWFM